MSGGWCTVPGMANPLQSLRSWWNSPADTAGFPKPRDVTGLWWQNPTDSLSQIVIDDIFGEMLELVDRTAAMRVPGVVRGRDLIVGGISDLPLVALEDDAPVAEPPAWTYRTASPVSLWHRWAGTLDDGIMHDCALWMRTNDDSGAMLDAIWIPRAMWQTVTRDDGTVDIQVRNDAGGWTTVPAAQLIYFPGPHLGSGLIASAADTIRGIRAMDRAWQARVRSPIPPTLFVQKEPNGPEQDEVDALTGGWAKARQNPDTAGVGFVPYGVEPMFPAPSDDSAMFVQGRNAGRLDVANFLNMPASLLDGSTATASLTYTTAEGQRSSFHEQTLRFWTAWIEHRLSMDDVMPEGQRVRFDITYNTQVAPAGEPGRDE